MELLKHSRKICFKNGSGFVEIIVGLSIIAVVSFTVAKSYDYYLRFALSRQNDIQAAFLAEEGIEAVKFLRDISWTEKILPLSPNVSYGLLFDGATWQFTAAPSPIYNIFYRTFVMEEVYRNSNDQISGTGVLDSGTRKLIVNVSYRNIFGTTTKSISTYITNIFND